MGIEHKHPLEQMIDTFKMKLFLNIAFKIKEVQ